MWINIAKFLSSTHLSIIINIECEILWTAIVHLYVNYKIHNYYMFSFDLILFTTANFIHLLFKYLKWWIFSCCFNRKWHISNENYSYLTSVTRFHMLFFKSCNLFRGSNFNLLFDKVCTFDFFFAILTLDFLVYFSLLLLEKWNKFWRMVVILSMWLCQAFDMPRPPKNKREKIQISRL